MGLHLKIQQPNQADNTAYLETFDSYTSFSPLHPPVEDEGGGVFKDNAPSIITHSASVGDGSFAFYRGTIFEEGTNPGHGSL